jgi:peptidoglycan-associated lipoprotein
MSNDESPGLSKLPGENIPLWFIAGLLLVGSIGSVTTAQLLLPTELSIESFRTWASQSHGKKPDTETTTPDIRDKQTTSPIIDDAGVERPKVAGQDSPPGLTPEDELVTSSKPAPASVSTGDTSSATVATMTLEGEAQAPAKPPVDSTIAQECAPLFFVTFERGSVKPRDKDLSVKASKLAQWLNRHPAAKLLVEGHADAYGPEELNLFISHRRAKAVLAVLTSVGVSESQMTIRAFGEYSPLAGLPPESAQNRRVSLRIENVSACKNAESVGELP